MRMKPCDEEKSNYSASSSFHPKPEQLEMKEGGRHHPKKSREELQSTIDCPCTSSAYPSCSNNDEEEGEDGSTSSGDEQSSKKRKLDGGAITREEESALDQSVATPPTFHKLRPKLPLIVSPLVWKHVLWKDNKLMERLLLVNKETGKAYDGDFGFKLLLPIILDFEIEQPHHIYYPPKTKSQKVSPVYVRRNRSRKNELTGERVYRIPHFEDGTSVQWYFLDGDYSFEYGFTGNNKLKLEIIQIVATNLPDPPPQGGTITCFMKKVLKVIFEEGKVAYFDHDGWQKDALVGKSLHLDCRYGDVYLGRELVEKTVPLRTGETKILTVSDAVVIKAVTFDSPLNTYIYLPTELSQVEDKFQKVCLTESVVHEIEAMTFLQSQFCNDEAKKKRFSQLLHYQADYRNLYAITKGYRGGSLLYYKLEKTRFGKLSELEVKYVFKQIAEAIQIMHSFGMSHNDISPENIVFDCTNTPEMFTPEIQSVLIDFGQTVAQPLHPETMKFMKLPPRLYNVGKLPFHCPELCRFHGEFFKGLEAYCPQKVDIWQLGILLYVLLTGSAPFSIRGGLDPNKQFVDWIQSLHEKTIKQKEIVWKTDANPEPQYTTLCNTGELSCDVLSLLSDLLTLKPDQRPDIHKVLQHAWFNDSIRLPPPPPTPQTNKTDLFRSEQG